MAENYRQIVHTSRDYVNAMDRLGSLLKIASFTRVSVLDLAIAWTPKLMSDPKREALY